VRERARQSASAKLGRLACALLCLAGGQALAQVEGAPRIVDGATLEVAGQRFRLQGVRAPVLDQVCQRVGKPYPCGKVARAALWDLVGGRDVICTPVADADGTDEAVPATCTAGGSSLGEGMVESGWALADRDAGDPYGPLEEAARQAGRGLWRSEVELPEAGGTTR
jgi:endonuclease YncB( thermonuclease family)